MQPKQRVGVRAQHRERPKVQMPRRLHQMKSLTVQSVGRGGGGGVASNENKYLAGKNKKPKKMRQNLRSFAHALRAIPDQAGPDRSGSVCPAYPLAALAQCGMQRRMRKHSPCLCLCSRASTLLPQTVAIWFWPANCLAKCRTAPIAAKRGDNFILLDGFCGLSINLNLFRGV